MPAVLITRPAEDAEPLAARLAALGHETLAEPLLRIVQRPGPEPALDGVQALLFTSANGVRAYAGRTGRRDHPAYAVGGSTAAAARDAGFVRVESAEGDVYALAELVRRRCAPGAGTLLHIAAGTVARDLGGLLAGHGFLLRREALYDAVPAAVLSDRTMDALRTGAIGVVLFFSPRTALAFVKLLDAAGCAHHCRTVTALCLSQAVADAARTQDGGGEVPWREVRVAARPELDSLLELLPDPRR